MSDRIVQLQDRNDDNIYPVAGAATQGSITKAMLAEGVFEGAEISNPGNIAYVSTSAIQDEAVTTAKIADLNVTTAKLATGAVTSDKIDCETIESTRVDSSKNLTGSWQDLSALSSGAKANDVIVGRVLIKNTSGSGPAEVDVALTHTDNTIWEYQEAVIPADGVLTIIVWQKCSYDGGVKLRARVASGTASTKYCGILKIKQLSQ